MRPFFAIALIVVITFVHGISSSTVAGAEGDFERLIAQPGIICVLDIPGGNAQQLIDETKAGVATVYFQSDNAEQVNSVRQAAEKAGLLGTRLFASLASFNTVRLADNVADGMVVAGSAAKQVSDDELLRIMRPRATAFVGDRKLLKPVPAGIEDWSHPYHGPDNNPNSNDQLVRGDFRTQFIATPKFSPMPQQTVAAGGRMYKAMGHIAHKANQNEMLNTLLCINAYNGTILWKRPNPPGFMIHRNTMVATDDALYMGDHESCKIIDGVTGKVRDQITISEEISDGPVWKWMAIDDGVLYGLVGNLEIQVDTQRSNRRGLGHWPWGMWKGHDYKNPAKSFGFGRTFVAIDLKTKKQLWHYRDEQFLDSRAVCMKDGRIYCYSPENFLCCIDAADGKLLWKNDDKDLLDAIAPNERAQHYITGYATTCYMKCNQEYLFFAGPQRKQMVVASALDGKLAWTHPVGNLQLVLRNDAVFAAGQQGTTGVRLDYASGRVLNEFPARRACTRATGCIDSIFYRASGGTVRVMTYTNTAQHIAPMRPPCQDGVIISNGMLYWGPWMCGCQLSLYGNIGLAPVGAMVKGAPPEPAHVVYDNIDRVDPLGQKPGDWVSYRANNSRSDAIDRKLPGDVKFKWKVDICESDLPTAPVVAGGLVFIADRTGVVRALDMDGKLVWKQYTGGAVFYAPAVADDRLFVGSADGRVYAFEARTGRPLWSYRVAPEDRLVPIFGKLVSLWPVAGGVVVEDGRVYAAAGLTHYDGTHVVSLDVKSGKLLAANNTSGQLAELVNDGVSMQGNLKIVDGELRFLGGGVYETARFDLTTLKCLNKPKSQVTSQYRTAFYPYYPAYGKFVSLEYTCKDGNVLSHDASYEGSVFGNLALHTPLPPGSLIKDEAREFLRRRGRNAPQPKKLWEDKGDRRFTSFVASAELLVATGHPDKNPDKAFLVAIKISDGTDAWSHALPSDAVKGGTAVDANGRVFVALENGQLWCFAK
jgi:outer membrane protein assembly factor BamB